MKTQSYKDHTLLLIKVQKVEYPEDIEIYTTSKIGDLSSWYAVVVIAPGLDGENINFSIGKGDSDSEAENDAFKNAKRIIDGSTN